MSKRRLSDQQTRRIRARQEQSTSGGTLKDTTGTQLGAEQEGLVIAHFGRQVEIEALAEDIRGQTFRCHLRTNLAALVTGDRVVWSQQINAEGNSRRGIIVACHPRHSLLARPDSHSGQPKPVAANIDRLAIVIAPEPQPFANLIDRYIVAAENADIVPFIVLNKHDLLTAASLQEKREAIDALLGEYRAIGYTVVIASAHTSDGLDALKQQIHGHTCAFVGQSGVGKSSLLSTLLPGVEIRVGALSEAESKGRHTTTTARLFHLPLSSAEIAALEHAELQGCDLIDSPGIREFGLDHLNRTEVERGFIELRDWLGRCRFRDCRHQQEPGCALTEAAASGAISADRLRSFRAILATAST
ncbi:MAG: small ribosomal subunit biogenesis GTPase RsgA [Spongiibacteraceae bacterium]